MDGSEILLLMLKLFQNKHVSNKRIAVNLTIDLDFNEEGDSRYLVQYLYSKFPSVKFAAQSPTSFCVNENNEQLWIEIEQSIPNFTLRIYNDVFMKRIIKDEEELAFVIMHMHRNRNDRLTQGLTNKLFAFANLISSNLCIISKGTGQLELGYIETAIKYDRYILSKMLDGGNGMTPSTTFIIKENETETFGKGIDGGKKYLEHCLQNNKAVKITEHDLKGINCILIRDSELRMNHLDYESFTEIRNKIILVPEPKIYNGSELRGSQFMNFIQDCLICLYEFDYSDEKILFKQLFERNKNHRYNFQSWTSKQSTSFKQQSEDESSDESDSENKKEIEESCRHFISEMKEIKTSYKRPLPSTSFKKVEEKVRKKILETVVIDKSYENQFVLSKVSTIDISSKFQVFCYLEHYITEDVLIHLVSFLNNNDVLNFIASSNVISNIIGNSRAILKKFTLHVSRQNFETIYKIPELKNINLLCASLNLEGFKKMKELKIFLNQFKPSIEILEIKNLEVKNYAEFNQIIGNMSNLKSLSLEKCKIDCTGNETMKPLASLQILSFNKCWDNVFSVFKKQENILQISVRNDDWTWNGFPHETYNEILRNSKKLEYIILLGSGTGSYFDCDEFPYKITKLTATMITFHWYVGIKTQKISFLNSQMGHLKELTIHKLPFDFDGGRVLKFIFEKMNLQQFYYGKIPLILNGKKQQVDEFEATEIQIQSFFEIFRQYRNIKRFRLILSETDIASDEIEKVINPYCDIFDYLEVFEVVDNSRYRGILGVFLGLFKNLRNIKKLIFITQDRNINVLLEECLPFMHQLTEITLTSTVARSSERFKIIKNLVPNLNKINVAAQYAEEAMEIFGEFINVCKLPSTQ